LTPFTTLPVTSETSLPIAAPEEEQRWLLVSASGRRFALAIEPVREVVPARGCTRIPGAPACVSGLLNLRGHILTVVDLASRLDLPASQSPGQRVVVMKYAGREVGLEVDEVLRIAALPGGVAEDGDPFEVLDVAALLGPIFGRPEDR
jgi:purine-binding chemotaxis protein CheW